MKNGIKNKRVALGNGGGDAAKDFTTQHYLRLLVTVLLSFLAPAVFLFPEKFLFEGYPLSYLGRMTSPQGLPNTISRILFDSGMFLCAYTMYLLARYYHRKHPVPDSPVYELLSYISATGFILMMFPCDVQQVQFMHSFGSGFMVGSHFFMAFIRLLAVHNHRRGTRFVLLAILFISVVLYAVLWFFKIPNHGLFQKPAIAALIYVELYGSSLSRYYGEHSVFHLSPA